MDCPACQTTLAMTDRHGIEIDYCPKCRGVWLDRGELDKLIERATSTDDPVRPPEVRQERPHTYQYDERGYGDQDYGDRRKYDRDEYYRRRKKKSFWSEIFDFD